MSLSSVMSAAVTRQLTRIGGPVTLIAPDGERKFWAYVQPEGGQSKTERYPSGTDNGSWLYRGPVSGGGELLADGLLLLANDRWFVADEVRDYFVAGQPVLRTACLTSCYPLPNKEVDG